MSAREQAASPEVEARVRRIHEQARELVFALGRHVWTPEERTRVLWAAMRDEPTTVTVKLNPIEISVWCGSDLVAFIPCTSVAEPLQ